MLLLPAPLLALIALLVVAVGVAAHALLRDRERKNLLSRAGPAHPAFGHKCRQFRSRSRGPR